MSQNQNFQQLDVEAQPYAHDREESIKIKCSNCGKVGYTHVVENKFSRTNKIILGLVAFSLLYFVLAYRSQNNYSSDYVAFLQQSYLVALIIYISFMCCSCCSFTREYIHHCKFCDKIVGRKQDVLCA